jgi:NADP-dependent 3-hydroxy acid dehydrogenase YdfG
MNSPTKRIAWITGGGTGIGLAGAAALAKEGWQVVISGRRSDVLSKAADAIRSQGGVAVDQIVLDVENVEQVSDTAAQILKKHKRIDVLINSAGLNVSNRSWESVTTDAWDSVVNVNLNGLVYCIKAVLPAMIEQKDGCIINVASWAGRHVTDLVGPAYTASKAAVIALTHELNIEQYKNGIRASVLCPGEVATDIMKQRPVPPSEEVMAKMLQSDDLGRTISFVANMPPHVCVNEILISPTWNRVFQ